MTGRSGLSLARRRTRVDGLVLGYGRFRRGHAPGHGALGRPANAASSDGGVDDAIEASKEHSRAELGEDLASLRDQ